ncbi:MAG: hypothetical protein AB7G93_05615 [Bdellovibrionales bacterium]
MGRLSLSFSSAFVSLLLLLVWIPSPAVAIHVHALYTASCQRQIGIILGVGPRHLSMLNLDGEVVDVERFEVIYYAAYSADVAPIPRVQNPERVPLVVVRTFQGGRLAELVRGWPVDFNNDKISFLTLRGSEVAIDRTSIWELTYDREHSGVEFSSQPKAEYEFIHPYAFSSCSNGMPSKGKIVRVFPHELLSDPVAIKRQFDRLAQGHQEVQRYEKDQQFYPVPEVYSNETSLGLWLSAGSRYGASTNRDNNFTPLLINRTSSGPFGFQSEFRTGSGPLSHSLHEEPQTQAYYRMKADYFHLSAMADPNLLLVGSKYKWFENDLNALDARPVETATFEMGFDYGKMALELYLGGAINTAARFGEFFDRDSLSLFRTGIRYQGLNWMAQILGGSSSRSGFDLFFLRANLEWFPVKHRRYMISFIQRDLGYDGADSDTGTLFSAEANTRTAALYAYWRVRTRYWTGAFLAAEQASFSGAAGSSTDSKSAVYPKLGAMVSLSF